jgi:hypothetical protein
MVNLPPLSRQNSLTPPFVCEFLGFEVYCELVQNVHKKKNRFPHCFSVSFNCVTKDAAFYTTSPVSRPQRIGAFPQERQELWLPKDDLRDSSSWSSPPLVLLRDIHSKFLTQFDCKEVCASSPSQVNGGSGTRLNSQDGVSQ